MLQLFETKQGRGLGRSSSPWLTRRARRVGSMGLGGVQLGGAEIEEDGRRQDGMYGLGRGVVGGS